MSRSLPLISDNELVPGGFSSPAADDEPGFGSLMTEKGHLPLEAMDVRGRIDGLLARVIMRQTFVNALDEPLEATYIFPLPDRAAVTRFRMEVAGRVIEGVLEERGQAREHYDQAIAQGRRAAIAEEDRPGVFNLRVGNLMPGERATVELTLCGVLPYSDGAATFRFPLVVAPRYIPGVPLPGPSVGDGTAVDTNAVPDASRITPPVLLPGFPNPVRLSLEIELHDGGADVDEVRCSLHAVNEEPRDGYRRIRLYAGERLNRDFILRFRLGGPEIRSTLTLHPDATGGEGTFALTVVPPATEGAAPQRPRDVVFVLDRSGSMGGWKMVAARRAVARMIDTLNDTDQFCVLAFDNVVESPPGLTEGLAAATDRHRFRAVEYLAKVDSRGGTEMAQPIERAVTLLDSSASVDRDRILVLITDGQVGNEDQVLKVLGDRLKKIRIFTLGIDRSVNEAFLRRLAERGGGSCELVESEDRLDEIMAAVHRRIGTPILTGLSLTSDELGIEPGEVVPRRLPDLFAGSPLLILGRYRGRPVGTVIIHATAATGRAWSEPIPGQIRENPAIAAAWARGQVRQLEDRYAAKDGDLSRLEKAIVAISLEFQVLCRFTAYVAVDRSQVANKDGALHRITQPVEQPEGWDQFRGTAAGVTYLACDMFPKSASLSLPRAGGGMASRRDRRSERSPDAGLPLPPTSAGHASPAASLGRVGKSLFGAIFGGGEETTARLDDTAMSMPPGIVLPDRFESGQTIALGGLGQVWKAFDRQLGQPVVIKVLPALRLRGRGIHDYRRVLESVSQLNHPAIIPILDVVEAGTWIYIVAPFLSGSQLAERLQALRRMDPRQAAELVAEVAEAVHLVHGLGVIHGDLKPGNILMGDDGRPRLLGFEDYLPFLRQDPSGPIAFTPAYAPPEQIQQTGRCHDVRVDVYSLGVTLYELLTGKPPFEGTKIREVFQNVLHHEPAPPRRLVRSIPAELEAICLKAMARNPDDRYPTAAELAAALRQFLKPKARKGFWK
jgi:Ca-activated chloride channel family protein